MPCSAAQCYLFVMDLSPDLPFTPSLGTSHVTAEESNHPQPGLASAPARSAHAGGPEGSR